MKRSVLIYAGVVTAIYLIATHVSHLVLGRWGDLPTTYRRFPIVIPLFLGSAIIGITVTRIVHFIGTETLFHLMVGTYHRPVLRDKVLVFVGINGSTGLAQRLGPLETRSLIGKFLFDIARPIIDHGGEIYVYEGDGLIALWDWDKAMRRNALLRAVDALFAACTGEQAAVSAALRGRADLPGSEYMAASSSSASKAIPGAPSVSMETPSTLRRAWRTQQRRTGFLA